VEITRPDYIIDMFWKLSVLSPSIFTVSDNVTSHPATHILDGRSQSL